MQQILPWPAFVVLSCCTLHRMVMCDDGRQCPFGGSDPCDCSWSTEDSTAGTSTLSISCRRVQHSDQLTQITETLRTVPESAAYLYLYQSDVDKLDFAGLGLHGLYLQDTDLSSGSTDSSHTNPVVSGVENSLEELRLWNCGLRVPSGGWTLGHLPNLVRFSATDNEFSHLGLPFFREASPNLRYLYLFGNRVVHVEPNALAAAKKLKILNLNRNRIAQISRAILPNPAEYLTEIHLRYNLISHLPEDVFLNMPGLKLVDLSWNQLQRLPEGPWWRPVWSRLPSVYLEGNPFRCDCQVLWMVYEEMAMANETKRNRFLYGRCQEPIQFRERRLEDLKPSDFNC